MTRCSACYLLALTRRRGTGAHVSVGKPFKVISISGFDVQKAGITLTVTPERKAMAGRQR